jgi:hypothetical protein
MYASKSPVKRCLEASLLTGWSRLPMRRKASLECSDRTVFPKIAGRIRAKQSGRVNDNLWVHKSVAAAFA